MSDPVWSAIVWGRTRDVDVWWRAVPESIGVPDLRGLVEGATIASPARLDTPRFLLARRYGHWIVGGACAASTMSGSMNRDKENRELKVFVGWSAPVDEQAPPCLASLHAGFAEWAGPVYESWMALDWELSRDELRHPHRTKPGSPPWELSRVPVVGGAVREAEPAPLSVSPGVVRLYPEPEQHRLWARGLASTRPFVLVVGWQRRRNIPLQHLTHGCGPDVQTAEEVVVEDGLDLSGEQSEAIESLDVGGEHLDQAIAVRVPHAPDEEDAGRAEPEPSPRRSGWLGWGRARETERLAGEVKRLSRRLAAAEREIAALRAALDRSGSAFEHPDRE
jgi:hypothetical protein